MLWVKAFHIISMVAWFSGLFYLPRLFYYHAQSTDTISIERFKIMERKLYYIITLPAAFATIFFGIWLLSFNYHQYLSLPWMHAKLTLVVLLIFYQHFLGRSLRHFAQDKNKYSPTFYRYINEAPTIFLILIVILVVVKPF